MQWWDLQVIDTKAWWGNLERSQVTSKTFPATYRAYYCRFHSTWRWGQNGSRVAIFGPPQSSIWTFSTTTALISTILRALERCCVGEVHRKKRKVEYKYRNIINTTVTMTENFWEIGSMVLFNFWKTCSHASNMMQRLVFLWDFDAVDGQIAYAAAGCSKPAVTRARDHSRRGQQLCWRFNHQQRRNL